MFWRSPMGSSEPPTIPDGHPWGSCSTPPTPLSHDRKNRERAARRVEGDYRLRDYRYVLLDDPLLVGPSRCGFPGAEDGHRLAQHFEWLMEADSWDVMAYASFAEADFQEIFREYLESVLADISTLPSSADKPSVHQPEPNRASRT